MCMPHNPPHTPRHNCGVSVRTCNSTHPTHTQTHSCVSASLCSNVRFKQCMPGASMQKRSHCWNIKYPILRPVPGVRFTQEFKSSKHRHWSLSETEIVHKSTFVFFCPCLFTAERVSWQMSWKKTSTPKNEDKIMVFILFSVCINIYLLQFLTVASHNFNIQHM